MRILDLVVRARLIYRLSRSAVLSALSTMLCAACFLGASDGFCADKLAIGVFDIETVYQESSAHKGIVEQYNRKTQAIREELEPRGHEMQEKFKTLDAQKSILSYESYSRQHEELQKEVMNLQNSARNAEMKAQTAVKEALNTLHEQMKVAAKSIAEDSGMKVIVTKNAVFYNAGVIDMESADITKQFSAKINEILPSIAVVFDDSDATGRGETKNDAKGDDAKGGGKNGAKVETKPEAKTAAKEDKSAAKNAVTGGADSTAVGTVAPPAPDAIQGSTAPSDSKKK